MFMIDGPHRLQMQLPRLTTSNRQTADNELRGERQRGRQDYNERRYAETDFLKYI